MNKFKCKICDNECHINYSGTHLKKKHNISGKIYYDKYLNKVLAKERFAKKWSADNNHLEYKIIIDKVYIPEFSD